MKLKRIFDLCFSILGLIPLLPFFALIAALIKIDSKGPVLFRQIRVGQFGLPFRIYKFRTMCRDAECLGAQVSTGDDPRITRIGHFLRKYKIDELPQLLNVITGDLSLVGPRPEVPRYVEEFRDEYKEILKVRPGITDFASLEYKNENELLRGGENPEEKYINEILPEKIKYYQKYIAEQSFFTDLKLILRTVWAIIK